MWVTAIPSDVWGRRGTVLVALAVLAPQVATRLWVDDARNATGIAVVSGLVTSPALLTAAVLLYFHWRLTHSPFTGWMALCLTVVAVQGLVCAGLRAASQVQQSAGWVLATNVVLVWSIVVVVRKTDRAAPRVDPMTAGFALGLVVVVAHILVSQTASGLVLPPALVVSLCALLVAGGLVAAHAISRTTNVPAWAAQRLALAVALLATRGATGHASDQEVLASISLVAGCLAAVIVVYVSAALMRMAIRDTERALCRLQDHLARLVEEGRADRERMHEIKGTVAGIACASRLIHDGTVTSWPRRSRLEEMLEAESARLARLVDERDQPVTSLSRDAEVPAPPSSSQGIVDIDDAIRPLVTAQQARGRNVTWNPSGLRVHGHQDRITEVLHILLENAARHAPRAPVSISARLEDDTVEIEVADRGPGIPTELMPSVFDWEIRGAHSSGQGIGLYTAHRLMDEPGSYLRLEGATVRGSSFVIGLRAVREVHGRAEVCSQ